MEEINELLENMHPEHRAARVLLETIKADHDERGSVSVDAILIGMASALAIIENRLIAAEEILRDRGNETIN